MADQIIDYARANNVTHIIVGKSSGRRWREWLAGSVARRVISRAGGINIHVIEAPAEKRDIAPAAASAEAKPPADVETVSSSRRWS